MKEQVVATVAIHAPEIVEDFIHQVDGLEAVAETMIVEDEATFQDAGRFLGEIKQKISSIKDSFQPIKKEAFDAHKAVCNQESQLLSKLEASENMVKKEMADYIMKKKQAQLRAEEAARRLIAEETERKLDQAVQMEQAGDSKGASAAMLDAEISDQMVAAITVPAAMPKAEGITTKFDYEIVSVDANQVPDQIMGTLIRPVDEKAVLRLIRGSRGTIQIPGIQYKEVVKITARKGK
jgi:hypothetical protein